MNNQSDSQLNEVTDKTLSNTVDLISLSIFDGDPYFSFVYKKAEKLCLATFLITDFFPVGDSIKDSLRKAASGLLRTSLSLITAPSPLRKNVLNELSSLCLEIVSLSRVASHLGIASIANHDVLENEIKNFITVIEDREKPKTLGCGFVLNEEILRSDESREDNEGASGDRSFSMDFNNKTHNQADNKDNIIVKKTDFTNYHSAQVTSQTTSEVRGQLHNQIIHNIDLQKKESKNVITETTKDTLNKNERRDVILNIIKEIGETSIKDISDSIKDCSEKTIQRELNSLIYGGVIKKIGERRWSKYLLV